MLEYAIEEPDFQYILLTPNGFQVPNLARQQAENHFGVTLGDDFLKLIQMPEARPEGAIKR